MENPGEQLLALAQFLLGPLALGDVEYQAGPEDGAVILFPGRCRAAEPAGLARGADHPPLPQPGLEGPVSFLDRGIEAGQVVGVNDIEPGDGVGDQIGRLDAQDLLDGRADVRERWLAGGVDPELIDNAGNVRRHVPEPLLALAQFLLGPFALGDIDSNADDSSLARSALAGKHPSTIAKV